MGRLEIWVLTGWIPPIDAAKANAATTMIGADGGPVRV
jgi:hypothetical protein